MKEYTEKERIEWDRRIKILRDQINTGKFHVASHIAGGLKESLLGVKMGPDGLVDMSTLDSRIRATALGVAFMHDREEMKRAISLREIQEIYFDLIDLNFGDLHKVMVEKNLTPDQLASQASKFSKYVEAVYPKIPEFLEILKQFWEDAMEPAQAHIEDLQKIKAVFGGDMFPSPRENIVSKCGIYTDVTILCDPFLKTETLLHKFSKERSVEYFVKHALNILKYKSLALADVDPPIVVILPERFITDSDTREIVSGLATQDLLLHCSLLFKKEFKSFEELDNFARSLDSAEKLSKYLKPEDLPFNVEWKGTLEEQIKKALTEFHAKALGFENPGVLVIDNFYGRFAQSNDLLYKSFQLRGTPLVEAPTSWRFFNKKLELEARRFSEEEYRNLHILKGLQSSSDYEMQWLGNIPPEVLIEIRKQGAMDEIRAILASGIDELVNVRPENFHRSGDQIVKNLQSAFDQHRETIRKLRGAQWRFAGVELGSCIVRGTLGLAAAITGEPLFGVGFFISSEFGSQTKMKDLLPKFQELRKKSREIRKSPIGLLFDVKKETEP